MTDKKKALISEPMKGEKNPSFGKTPSAETKALLSAAKTGAKHSAETKEKKKKCF